MRSRSWGILFGSLILLWAIFAFFLSRTLFKSESAWGGGNKDVLVMYLFAASDPEFVDNLRFFISEVAAQGPGDQERCDYVYILQDYRGDGTEVCHAEGFLGAILPCMQCATQRAVVQLEMPPLCMAGGPQFQIARAAIECTLCAPCKRVL